MISMIYALEILASGYRTMRDKAEAWKKQTEGTNDECDRLNEELDRTQDEWRDLMEFIRTALGLPPQSLGLDERAMSDKTDPRSILGQVFADARLLARIRDEVNGKFVAGSVVTADAMNTVAEMAAEPAKPWAMPGYTTRIEGGSLWMAPEGTDPADKSKWTHAGWTKNFTLKMDVKPEHPAVQHFPVGAPEPDARVQRVKRFKGETVFVRSGRLSSGVSLWRRASGDSTTYTWPQIVQWRDVVEVPA